MEVLPLRLVADGDAGIPTLIYYDPHLPRNIAHVKRLLAQDLPVLIRLHPGMEYPMDEDLLHYRVDREGHVVALIGYDDQRQCFYMADPWWPARRPGQWGKLPPGPWPGQPSGPFRGQVPGSYPMQPAGPLQPPVPTAVPLPYDQFKMIVVDACHGYDIVPDLWNIRANLPPRLFFEQSLPLDVQIEYPCPEPFSAAENWVRYARARLELPEGLSLAPGSPLEQPVGEEGLFRPGDVQAVRWQVVRTGPIDGILRVRVRGVVAGDDPYPYTDLVGAAGLVHIRAGEDSTAYDALPVTAT